MEWPQKPATTLQSSFFYRSQLIPSAFPADPEKKQKFETSKEHQGLLGDRGKEEERGFETI